MNLGEAPSPPPLPVRPPFRRPLVPVVLAFMAGIGASAWGLFLPRALALPLLAGGWLGLLWGWWTDRRLFFLPLMWFFLAGAALAFQAREPRFPPEHVVHLPQEEEICLRGRLVRPPRQGPTRLHLVLKAEAWLSPQGWRPTTGFLLVSAPLSQEPRAGSQAVLRGRLRPPRELLNPHAAPLPRMLAQDGIFRTVVLGSPEEIIWLGGSEPSLREYLRGGLRTLLGPYPREVRALYRALLLGEQGEISREMREALSRTGTAHLVAISGLHLGMAAAITYAAVWWLLRRSAWLLLRLNAIRVATVAAAVPVVGYAWLAGGSPATQRAEVMVLAFLAAVLLGRSREVVSALALAALVILALHPLRLFSPSFALSFSAVAGLLILMPRVTAWLPASPPAGGLRAWGWRLGRWLGGAFFASLAASLATAPLVAWFFNLLPLGGFLVNLAAIPLVLGLALPLGELAAVAAMPGLTPVAQALLSAGQWPLLLGWRIIELASRVPGAAIVCPTPTPFQLLLCYLLLLTLFLPRGGRLATGGAALAAVTLLVTFLLPASPPGVAITVLDHPGGLAALVSVPDGRRLLVSAGNPAYPGREEVFLDVVPRYLHGVQVRALKEVAALTLTPGNAPELLEIARRFRVGAWTLAFPREPSAAGVDLLNLLGDRGQPWRVLGREPRKERWGVLEVEFLPLGGGVALAVAAHGARVLFLPPVALEAAELRPWTAWGWDAVVAARMPAAETLTALKARRLVLYGDQGEPAGPRPPGPARYSTRQGAITLILAPGGVQVSPWPGHGAPTGKGERRG